MPVQINELESRVDVMDGASMLSPEVLNYVVQAVIRELERRREGDQTHASELDTRSIVEQQRGGRR